MPQPKFPRTLSIAVLPIEHIIDLNETVKNNVTFVGGIESDIIRVLSHFLRFKYNLLVPKDRKWGSRNHDGAWTGLVGMVNRSEADMAISFLSITEERHKAVDFIPYHTEETTFAAGTAVRSRNYLFYLYPFENSVWILCLLGLMTSSLLFRLFRKKSSYSVVLLEMVGNLMKEPSNFICETIKQRYILGAWNVFACLMTFSYTAVLLSFETVPLYQKGVETINELVAAVSEGNYKCYASTDSSDHDFLVNSNLTSLQYLGQVIADNGWMYSGEALPSHLEKNTAVIGQRSIFNLEKEAGVLQNAVISEENIAIWHAGIAVRKEFCCTERLAKVIRRIRSSGVYAKLYAEEVYRTKILNNGTRSPPITEKSLGFGNIYGSFLFLIGGLAFSTVIFLSELFAYTSKTGKRRKKDRDRQ